MTTKIINSEGIIIDTLVTPTPEKCIQPNVVFAVNGVYNEYKKIITYTFIIVNKDKTDVTIAISESNSKPLVQGLVIKGDKGVKIFTSKYSVSAEDISKGMVDTPFSITSSICPQPINTIHTKVDVYSGGISISLIGTYNKSSNVIVYGINVSNTGVQIAFDVSITAMSKGVTITNGHTIGTLTINDSKSMRAKYTPSQEQVNLGTVTTRIAIQATNEDGEEYMAFATASNII